MEDIDEIGLQDIEEIEEDITENEEDGSVG